MVQREGGRRIATHVLVEQLVQYPNELLEHERRALERRLLDTPNLLLDDDLEGSRADEECGRRTLRERDG